MIIVPSPGIVVIEPIVEENGAVITNDKQAETRIRKGKVIATGINLITDFNAILEMKYYAAVGDIVYFLSYEGDYDVVKENGKEIYLVKVQDIKGVIIEQ